MMRTFLTAFWVCVGIAAQVNAQSPFTAMKEHAVLKQDVGTWQAKGKMFLPGVDQAIEFEGIEKNEMVGSLWCVTDFTGDFGGMKFHGHGRIGYNPATKKYEATWFDSTNPYAMSMVGTYEESTKTFTMMSEGKDQTGTVQKGKSILVYKGSDKRVMTSYRDVDGEMVKDMEIVYTRKK